MATALTSGMAPLLSLHSGQNGRPTFTGGTGPHSLIVEVQTTTRAGKAVGITMHKRQRQHGGDRLLQHGRRNSLARTLSANVCSALVHPSYGAVTTVTLTYQ